MNLEKSIYEILDTAMDTSLGGASLAGIINLDKLLWLYHKELASTKGITTNKWWWFQAFTAMKPMHWLVRDAVDILKDYASAKPNEQEYFAEDILCDDYLSTLTEFYKFLSNKIYPTW